MQTFHVNPVGEILHTEKGFAIVLKQQYIPVLQALEGFSHIHILWWFDQLDNPEARNCLAVPKPYQQAPDTMGIFATRSPARPNPLALSVAEILHINYQNGNIQIAYIDAEHNSPVLDIKPYTPSLDRVENPSVPQWCSHWPKSLEESADFPWENEFNF